MKKLILAVLFSVFISTLSFANYKDDITSFKGMKVEIVLANNEKSIIGIFKDTSDYAGQIAGLILVSDNGAKIYISLDEIAAIKEIK